MIQVSLMVCFGQFGREPCRQVIYHLSSSNLNIQINTSGSGPEGEPIETAMENGGEESQELKVKSDVIFYFFYVLRHALVVSK